MKETRMQPSAFTGTKLTTLAYDVSDADSAKTISTVLVTQTDAEQITASIATVLGTSVT